MRTLIGQLLLRMRDTASPEAKKAAASITGSFNRIEQRANRLSSASWGARFQSQIDKLKISPADLAQIESSWNRLNRSIAERGLGKQLKANEIHAWKTATIGHFADVRRAIDQTEQRHKRFLRALREGVVRPALVMGGAYTTAYAGGLVARNALTASSQRERELFRQDQAGLKPGEKEKISAKASEVTAQYPSVPKTSIMELSRFARNLMGDAERGNKIIQDLIRTFVVLQSINGPQQALGSLESLIRGFDNIGVNKDGEKGVKQVTDLLDAVVKASQIEGSDFNVADFLKFARRSKVAGPALSQEFLGTTAPVLMQDSSAEIAGNQLAMFFKNFVVGVLGKGTGKHNLAERKRLGLLGKDKRGVLDSALAGRNPYEWVKKYLVPALQKDGVNILDGTEVSRAVGKLTGNTNVSGLLSRLITQSEQIERNMKLYEQSLGINAADQARFRDPFVGLKAFTGALDNLSSAVGEKTMPTIVSGLNKLADAVNVFADNIEKNDPTTTKLGVAAVAGVGGLAAVKTALGIRALVKAGPELQKAATMLQASARAQGIAEGAEKKKSGFLKNILKTAPLVGSLAFLKDEVSAAARADMQASGKKVDAIAAKERKEFLDSGRFNPLENSVWDKVTNDLNTLLTEGRNEAPPSPPSWAAGVANMQSYRANKATPDVAAAKSAIGEVEAKADAAGKNMAQSLSPTAKPIVDTSSIDAAIASANRLNSIINGIRTNARGISNDVNASLRRTLSDTQSVTP